MSKKKPESEKLKVGRKPKYDDPAKMQRDIDAYFASCEGTILTDKDGEIKLNKYGQPIIIGAKPPTVTGLTLALNFEDRRALLNYAGKPEFRDVVSRAKRRIESYAESRLYDKDGQKGAEFVLRCNFGWQAPKDEPVAANDDAHGVVMIPAVMTSTAPAVADDKTPTAPAKGGEAD